MEKYFIHAYTGSGKGKTTAAVGLAVRAAGAEKKVLYVQLLKNGSSENRSLSSLGIRLIAPRIDGFLWEMTEQQKKAAAEAVKDAVKEALSLMTQEAFDMVVFDEILDALEYGMVSMDDMEDICAHPCELVLTGRKIPPELAVKCGYISEILAVKHPYAGDGALPRKGIEF